MEEKVYPERSRRVADELSSPGATLSVAVALSGGVDSAVAAALLEEKGFEVLGVHFQLCTSTAACSGVSAEEAARRVASHLSIPFFVWDLRKAFQRDVIDYFLSEYREGRTPVPCAVCNRLIKFGVFLDKALDDLGADKVATGHYARVARAVNGKWQIVNGRERENGDYNPVTINHKLLTGRDTAKDQSYFSSEERKKRFPKLLAGVDKSKDQSYFLWALTQDRLRHILFPVGDLTKQEVRAKAQELDLPCASRSESQGVCFVGPSGVDAFLRDNFPIRKGLVVDSKGETIGEHDGVWFYTEGQRHGFSAKGGGYPLYVVGKDVKTNTLTVGRGRESEVQEFAVESVNWISPSYQQLAISNQLSCGVRIRHLGELMPAEIKMGKGKSAHVELRRPARGVAPGQNVVFYVGDEVLGGGIIAF